MKQLSSRIISAGQLLNDTKTESGVNSLIKSHCLDFKWADRFSEQRTE